MKFILFPIIIISLSVSCKSEFDKKMMQCNHEICFERSIKGMQVPNWEFTTYEGQNISTYDINLPIILLNYKEQDFINYLEYLNELWPAYKDKLAIIVNVGYDKENLDNFRFHESTKNAYQNFNVNNEFYLIPAKKDITYNYHEAKYINAVALPKGIVNIYYISRDKKIMDFHPYSFLVKYRFGITTYPTGKDTTPVDVKAKMFFTEAIENSLNKIIE